MRFLKLLCVMVMVCGLMIGSLVQAAAGGALSEGSALSVQGASVLVEGSIEVLAASSELTVLAVGTVTDGASVVLESAANAATVSVKVTPELAGYLSKAIGTTVEVVAESSGYALMHAGRMIAFIPNEVSQGLLHHAPHSQ